MRASRPVSSKLIGRRGLCILAAALVASAVLALGISGAPGDAGLAVAFGVVAVLSLPCMVVWLIRGGGRR
jgi:hypothetical protein